VPVRDQCRRDLATRASVGTGVTLTNATIVCLPARNQRAVDGIHFKSLPPNRSEVHITTRLARGIFSKKSRTREFPRKLGSIILTAPAECNSRSENYSYT